MFQKVDEPDFVAGEHEVLRFWEAQDVFRRLQAQNARGEPWSFLDGPITANNPMGVHHAWGRTYKDAFQRYRAMTGRKLRYQNGFDCQGLWVEVEVEKELNLGTKTGIADYGIDRFVRECKKRVLKFAARQTEQSVRLGYWMEWDDAGELRKLSDAIGGEGQGVRGEGQGAGRSEPLPLTLSPQPLARTFTGEGQGGRVKGQGEGALEPLPLALSPQPLAHTYRTARGQTVTAPAEQIAAKLGNPEWGGSYFTFSTENNETIWAFLKKCFERKKIYQGHDVMPWSGRAGSAYSQMEVADGRKLTTHRSCFVRFRLLRDQGPRGEGQGAETSATPPLTLDPQPSAEYLLVWTTTPWTLTSNVACAVNPELEYVKLRAKKDGAVYYFAKDNLEFKRLEKEFKEGFGRPEWSWPEGVGKLKSIAQLFKEQGGYEIEGTLFGDEMVGWRYEGPFDGLRAQSEPWGWPPKGTHSDDRADVHLEVSPPFTSEDYGPQPIDGLSERNWARQVRDLFRERLVRLVRQASTLGWFAPREADTSLNGIYSFLTNLRFSDDTQFLLNCIQDAETLTYIQAGDYTPLPGDDRESELAELWQWIGSWNGASTRNALDPAFLVQLRVKQREYIERFVLELPGIAQRNGIQSHRIIDGGRDSKGSAIVVAGEGTGIVHIAPGCGDVDHQIGKALGLPIIAPLGEDGTFGDGFGPFTGRRATDPDTAQMVFDSLKDKGLLVAVETYPHIYPFCWRTGDELVFRLVDEWFISMDWREEIKEVVDTIEWLPPSIEGRDREREWLTNMRDWMISKKRFWGLALPIWVNPEDATDFEVMGSLAELKERALEAERELNSAPLPGPPPAKGRGEGDVEERFDSGWGAFEGHTPHRPWIDGVRIKSRKTGAVLSRIVDVGNPWLDAGIVPFSTLGYNEWTRGRGGRVKGQVEGASEALPLALSPQPLAHEGQGGRVKGQGEGASEALPLALSPQPSALSWPEWYPPEFVVECFPGQFRNWFYSLLALSTMMRHDETDVPAEKRPFKTLLGHRLVMNEEGKPMHKSDGTAIWFEEAAEQLGVDTLRWLYLAQDPASDLRFGTRHKDEPVTLPTVDGPLSHTREGLPCCKVTSKPADEVRRQVLIPLWNSYAFFVNYARLDGFDPSLPQVPVAQRPEIDRWILSNLQTLLKTANERFCAYDTAAVCKAATAFIDDLSNWYIRRNRRRFWRSRGEGQGARGEGQGARGRSEVGGQRAEVGSQVSTTAFSGEPKATPSLPTPHDPLPTWDPDKLAAYQTLYEVLVTLAKALAPVVPFLSERMYGNLVFGDRWSVVGQGGRAKGQGAEALDTLPLTLSPQPSATSGQGVRGEGQGAEALDTPPLTLSPQPSALADREPRTDNREPLSVHLCAYPQADESLIDAGLSARMATAQRVVSMGLRLRDAKDLRVRQPLAELRYAATDELAEQIAALEDVIDDELNVKSLRRVEHLDDLVRYTYKPNLKTLGPKYGKLLNVLRTKIPELGDAALRPLRAGQAVTVTIDGAEVTLQPEDVMVATEQAGEWSTADEPGLQIALSTVLTPELVQEGMARDFVRHVQQARKDADLEITDRIRVYYSGAAEVAGGGGGGGDYIARETLADVVELAPTASAEGKSVSIGEMEGWVWIERG